jgi:hypothetical protein
MRYGRVLAKVLHARNSKIKKLWFAERVNQDVVGFQIAMDYRVPMEVGNGFAYLQKNLYLLAQGKVVAILIDRRAVDILHRQIGLAVFGVSGIEQVGDIRVCQGRENLAFSQKPFTMQGAPGGLHQLDGRALSDLPIHALSEIDYAHTAPAKHTGETEWAAARSDRVTLQERRTGERDNLGDVVASLGIMRE